MPPILGCPNKYHYTRLYHENARAYTATSRRFELGARAFEFGAPIGWADMVRVLGKASRDVSLRSPPAGSFPAACRKR